MSEIDTGGTNWLLGLDKLTAPTLDFLGLRIRDKIRSYLSSKARERASFRTYERDFILRQVDLMNFGGDQFSTIIECWEQTILEIQLGRFRDSLKSLVESRQIDPVHLMSVMTKGIGHQDVSGLSPDDMLIYTIGASVTDCLVASHSLKVAFHLTFVPTIVHRSEPNISDEELDGLLESQETLDRVASEVRALDHDIGDRTAEIICEVYGVKWPVEGQKA